jgi:cysteine synthase A
MPSLPLLDRHLVDGFLTVSDVDAIDAARRLARNEGIFAGFSGGPCLVGPSNRTKSATPRSRGRR